MTASPHDMLSQAKGHFYSLRLNEAYALFRRYFDRLPFHPEPGHAEFIGMFARVLVELGKTSELKFYMGELERWHAKCPDPAIAYQLGVVYVYLPEPRIEAARHLFERLMRDPNAKSYRLKARMMLADYYDEKKDVAACRQLIFGVELDTIDDLILRLMYRVWRAKILRDEGRLDEAQLILELVLTEVSVESNWYVYWWSKTILARLYHLKGNKNESQKIIQEVRKFLKSKRCRSLENHLRSLEEYCRPRPRGESLRPKERLIHIKEKEL